MTRTFIVTFTTDEGSGHWFEKFDTKELASSFCRGAVEKSEGYFDDFKSELEGNDYDYEDIDQDSIKVYQAELVGRPKITVTIEL